MVLLVFMMLMIGALPLVNSSLEEKMQRIAEVLLGSARPLEIMTGKLLGNLGASLTAASVYIGGGILVCWYMGWTEHVPWHLLPWVFVYTIAAVVMCGAMGMAVGAACNDAKEIQSLMPVLILPFLVPIFVVVPILKEPSSSFATGMSLVPPFAPMLMLLRQSIPGGVPAWQVWTALAGVVAFAAFCVWAGGRIFRVGLLMQGKPPKLRDLARWAVQG
jgi:ABC-2 type transport system permease protein